jgi:outer membrane receptor for ferrienterochelin and colicin
MSGPNVPVTATPAGLPLLCPQQPNPDGSFSPVAACPRQFVSDVYRLVGALYTDLQYRPLRKLALDAGVRLQQGFGGRPYDLTPLYSGALVWNFLPDYHLKLNYTTGFRPPVFNNTDAVGGGILYGANPKLKNETSQSFQGEVNARVLRNVHQIRELEMRVDYSYTFLDNLIEPRLGSYGNTGKRAIHSIEGNARLYLNGDHFLQASYTYLYAVSDDTGVLRNMPNQWFTIGGSFSLIKNVLSVNTNLMITGAYLDPNRYASQSSSIPGTTTVANTTDLSWDTLSPVALLQLGFRLRFFREKIAVSGQFYNVLNQRYWYFDALYDLTPSQDLAPTPAPGFSFFAAVTYRP